MARAANLGAGSWAYGAQPSTCRTTRASRPGGWGADAPPAPSRIGHLLGCAFGRSFDVIFVGAQAVDWFIDLQQPPVELVLNLFARGIRRLPPQLLAHHRDADIEHLEGKAKLRSWIDSLPTHEASVANSANADLRMRTPLSTCTAGSEPSFTIR